MQLTPEQQAQLQHAKEDGERRVLLQFTPEQKKAYRESVAEELSGKEENLAHYRKVKSAAEQPGFLGDIRRAILRSRRPLNGLATAIGIEGQALSDFLSGDAELPVEFMDRLLEALGLRLMQEIPR